VILEEIRAFDEFDEDNDPHGEHDVGLVEVGDIRCLGRSISTTKRWN
jgi:hypothetical protein